MKIKKCSLDDILDLQKIYRQTFFETFSEQNSEENMRIFLDKAYSEEKLKSEIENKESETFLAVEICAQEKVFEYLNTFQEEKQDTSQGIFEF